MAEYGVEMSGYGMSISFPCGCKIILKAEDGGMMMGMFPAGTFFKCKHAQQLTFTGKGKWMFSMPFGTVYTKN